jgi:hypothetical protein
MNCDVVVPRGCDFNDGGGVEGPCCAQRGQQVVRIGDEGVGDVVSAAEASEVDIRRRCPALCEFICRASEHFKKKDKNADILS